MKKIIILTLALCIIFTGMGSGLSINAAEVRSAACAVPNCPGFLRTRTEYEPQADFTIPCQSHAGCTITCKDVVARIVVTYCSVCNKEWNRGIQAITSTEIHSKPGVILPES